MDKVATVAFAITETTSVPVTITGAALEVIDAMTLAKVDSTATTRRHSPSTYVFRSIMVRCNVCLLYTSDAADE